MGPDTLVGRSALAGARVDDPRVSAIHAEISWRAEGFVMLARGGRLVVDGRGVRAVVLLPGQRITLAPGLHLDVIGIAPGDAEVVPATVGRDRLRFTVDRGCVRAYQGSETAPAIELLGVPGRLLATALGRLDRGTPWAEIAEAMWPEDAGVRATAGWTDVDERRFRNRWDQALVTARRALAGLGRQDLLVQRQGLVFVELGPSDSVELA